MYYLGQNKTIFLGKESSGKSLLLAMTAKELVFRNSKWNHRYGKDRPIVSNMRFSPQFEEWASEMSVRIEYWQNLDDLIQYTNADIICDEVGTYFDSRLWSDLSHDVRSWLQQGGKVGIEFYGAAQDFAQVDLSFQYNNSTFISFVAQLKNFSLKCILETIGLDLHVILFHFALRYTRLTVVIASFNDLPLLSNPEKITFISLTDKRYFCTNPMKQPPQIHSQMKCQRNT